MNDKVRETLEGAMFMLLAALVAAAGAVLGWLGDDALDDEGEA